VKDILLLALKRASRCLNFIDLKISIQDFCIGSAFSSLLAHITKRIYIYCYAEATIIFLKILCWAQDVFSSSDMYKNGYMPMHCSAW